MLGLLRRDERKPHRLCFAKYAAAFFQDFTLFLDDPQLLAEPRELLALGGRQAGLAAIAIGTGAVDPLPQRGGREIQLSGHRTDGLPLVEDEAHRLGSELFTELPARPPALAGVCCHCGHRIRLSESVHGIGSMPHPRTRRKGDWSLVCPQVWSEIRSGQNDAVLLHGYNYAVNIRALLVGQTFRQRMGAASLPIINGWSHGQCHQGITAALRQCVRIRWRPGRELLMKFIRTSAVFRKLMWRLGRKMYTYARGDGQNDARTNGEYWLLERVLKASPGPQVLLDVGANKGDWTAQALKLAHSSKDVHVHAFEPSRATRSMLVSRFAESSVVTVQPYALSEKVGEATFYSNEDGAGTNSLSPSSGLNAEVVKLITIDRFLQQSGIETVSMIKIDTEGFDLLVLRGADKSLHDGRIEIVQFEYNWRWLLNHASLRDVFDLISGTPYRLGKLVGETMEFYEEWHFELDRYFENNYVLVRNDSNLRLLGATIQFDESNVGVYA